MGNFAQFSRKNDFYDDNSTRQEYFANEKSTLCGISKRFIRCDVAPFLYVMWCRYVEMFDGADLISGLLENAGYAASMYYFFLLVELGIV